LSIVWNCEQLESKVSESGFVSSFRSTIRNVVLSSHLEFEAMDKVHKPGDSECCTPPSEPLNSVCLACLWKSPHSLRGWQFSVPELCGCISETAYPSSNAHRMTSQRFKSCEVDDHDTFPLRQCKMAGQHYCLLKSGMNTTKYRVAGTC
jgi:hypothetical protein